MKKTVVALLVVALLAGAGAFAYWRQQHRPVDTGPTLALAPVERRDIDVAAEAAGAVEPIRVIEVKSKASGEALEVKVETGDHVEAGALLATIDPRDVQSAYDQAVADETAARVHLQIAESEQARAQKIHDSGLNSPQDLEAAQQAAADARASLVRAQTNLRLAKERLADVIIRAPTAGTILTRTVEPGQIIASATANVSGGTTLFTMADLSSMQVRAKVDEVDVGQVQPEQSVRVSVDAYPGRSFVGAVAKVEPLAVVEQNVTLFPVLVRLANPEGLLRPGMNADVTIEIASRKRVVAVPNAAAVSVRDARAAAATLGLEDIDLRAATVDTSGSDHAGTAPAGDDAVTAAGDVSACMQLVQRVRTGGPDNLSDAERATLKSCRERYEARQNAKSTGAATTHPAVVFVQTPQGPRPRLVQLGLSDWDYSEVMGGLEPGDQVVLISVAQMQKQQQEMTERIRQRMAGPMGPGSATRRPRGGS